MLPTASVDRSGPPSETLQGSAMCSGVHGYGRVSVEDAIHPVRAGACPLCQSPALSSPSSRAGERRPLQKSAVPLRSDNLSRPQSVEPYEQFSSVGELFDETRNRGIRGAKRNTASVAPVEHIALNYALDTPR